MLTGDSTSRLAESLPALLAHIAEPVVIIDHDGNVLYHNPAFIRFQTGPLAKFQTLFYPRDMISAPQEQILTLLKQAEAMRIWRSHARPEVMLHWYCLSHCADRAMILLGREVIEQVDQRRLVEAARVARVNLMGEMVSEITHELNQPLSAISTYVSAAHRLLYHQANVPAEIIRVLAQIDAQAKRAADLIQHVKEFARGQSAKRACVGINTLIVDALQLAEVEAKWHHIEIERQLLIEDIEVMVDPILIEQVVLNLVKNAIDAVGKGAQCMIQVRVEKMADDLVRVSVLDQGEGIADELAGHLFEPFVTTKEQGMGMGLAICHSIIKAHDGQIGYERNNGYTIFHFSLPQCHRE